MSYFNFSVDGGKTWTEQWLSEKELAALPYQTDFDTVVVKDPWPDTPFVIFGKTVWVEWYRSGEGYFGDFQPDNPEDKELLRFDVYKRPDGVSDWEGVEDASYCTCLGVDESEERLIHCLNIIYKEYDDVLSSDYYTSVKKLGERLSWIGGEA